MNLLSTVFFEVFPPLSVMALYGIGLFFAHMAPKERRHWAILVLGCVAIFVLFRMGEHKLSSRYVAISIPVGVITAVYGIYGSRWPLWIKRLLVLLLVVIALGKVARINRYNNHYATLCRQIRTDAAGYQKPIIADFTRHVPMVQYYSGISAVSFVSIPSGKTMSDIIGKFLQDYRYRGDVLYVITKEAADASPMTADATTVCNGAWELFGSEYNSNRRNRKLRVYRFLPHILRTEGENGTDRDGMAVLYQTGFEEMKSFDAQQTRNGKVLLDRGISFFSQPVNLPAGWDPNPSHGYANDSRGEAEVITAHALTGSHSLRMKSADVISLASPYIDVNGDELRVDLQARALAPSRFGVMLYCYDGKRYRKSLFSGYVTVSDKVVKHYEFIFPMGSDCEEKRIRVCLALWDGEMIFDDILLTGRKKEGALAQ